MTTRRVIMLGEAPETGPKGYRSRRLSISENAWPNNLPDHKNNESTPLRGAGPEFTESLTDAKTLPRKWSLVRLAFNLMIAGLTWTYAISPYYEVVFGTLGLSRPAPEEVFLPGDQHEFAEGGNSNYFKESAAPMMPIPPKPMAHAHEEDEIVMSEIRTVKSEIHRLQREFNEKSVIHERDPYKDSRDAELSKIHEVIDSLTRRLDVMTEESKLAAIQSAASRTTTTTIAPAQKKKPPVNIANGNLGAIIWAEKTTYTSTFKHSVLSAILTALPQSKRYQDVKQQVHKWKGPEILLDEQPIRGYGDAYCVGADQGEHDGWFSVGIKLPYANLIEEIAIEYVREDLDQVPGLRPKYVKIETYRGGVEDSLPLESDDHEITFGEDGVFNIPARFIQPADRLVFKFEINNNMGACVYRIKVFGAFQKSSSNKKL